MEISLIKEKIYTVSPVGQLKLPSEWLEMWNMKEGGKVKVVISPVLIVIPAEAEQFDEEAKKLAREAFQKVVFMMEEVKES